MGIYVNDFNRLNRTAVGILKKKVLIIIVEGDGGKGLSLYELAQLLSARKSDGGFGCDVALNLGGGPSTQVLFKKNELQFHLKGLWKINNALVVRH